jgi:hypothetical protein
MLPVRHRRRYHRASRLRLRWRQRATNHVVDLSTLRQIPRSRNRPRLVLRHTLGQQRHRRQSLPRSDGSLRRQQMATQQDVLGRPHLRPQIQAFVLLIANNSEQEEGSLTSVCSSQLQPVATSPLLTQIAITIPSPWRLRSRRPCTITGRDDLRVVRTAHK